MIGSRNINNYLRASLAFAITLFVLSCSHVKYVPQGSYLLNKVKIGTDNQELNRDELDACLKQRDNTRILGFFRFHLWLYNLSSLNKPESWLKKAGEPPQIYSELLARQSVDQLRQYLHNKGYYLAEIRQSRQVSDKGQKIGITYDIHSGKPYKVGEISHYVGDSVLSRLFTEEYKPRYLRKDAIFDLDLLDLERDRLVEFYRNRGYYYFAKPLIYFEADTARLPATADLELFIKVPSASSLDSARIFKTYRYGDFTFNVSQGSQSDRNDTVVSQHSRYVFQENNRYNPALFSRLNKMQTGALYNFSQTQNTFNALNRLRQFRLININFEERLVTADSLVLDCKIDLAPLSKQSTSFDIEGTNTSGNFGVAGNLNYAHKNLFRGAEILNLRLKGAMERQQAIVSNQSLDFNTREFGVEATLSVPKLIGPGSFFPSIGTILPKTVFTLGYNYQKRPDYTRTISSLKMGYEWMTSETKRHNWNVIDFNMVNLSSFDPEFLNSIYDLYIRESFTDHLILATGYSFIFNTQPSRTRENYTYLRFSAESSGNLLSLASKLTGANKVTVRDSSGLDPQTFHKFLDTRYAQYVRGDAEYRKGYWLDKYNSVVGRLFVGVGLPYGNFDVLPFEKKYFTGGANGIRAWQVRSLGPGTYKAPAGSYPNQSGDIKLEANLEYRYKLIRFLDGAFFLDAGNVWAINEKDNRPGAQFRLGRFYRQLALGTGTGFRFDFDYFVFRLDLGLKVRDPAQAESNGWIIGARKLTGDDFNLSFAIGYPF